MHESVYTRRNLWNIDQSYKVMRSGRLSICLRLCLSNRIVIKNGTGMHACKHWAFKGLRLGVKNELKGLSC